MPNNNNSAVYAATEILVAHPELSDAEVSERIQKTTGKKYHPASVTFVRRAVARTLRALAQDKRGVEKATRDIIAVLGPRPKLGRPRTIPRGE